MFRVALAMMAISLGTAASGFAQGVPDALACRIAARNAELAAGIPAQLLSAIARVESGRRNPATGAFGPWPWTINVEGEGFFFNSKAEAVAAVRAHQARGVRSIDVGCMQINLMHHPSAFPSLEQAFDPTANARYAARFLSELKARSGEWNQAAANYHSYTPERAAEYQRRVMAAWPQETRLAPETARAAVAQAWPRPGGRPPPGWGVTGGAMLSNRAANVRTLPLPSGGVARGLAAYRTAPIALASRHQAPPRTAVPRRF